MDIKGIYTFLKSLARHNDREWFNTHKDKYLKVKASADEFATVLIELVGEVEPAVRGMRPSDVTYRIYRDTRFSADKTPYKTHIGYFINPRGKKSLMYGYYFHFEPGASLICAGNIPGPSDLTRALRNDIYNNVEEYLSIIESPEFKQYFTEIGMDPLTKAPQGFPKDWEHIDLLKPRAFGASMNVSDDYFCADADTLRERLRPVIAQMKRINDFFNYTVADYE